MIDDWNPFNALGDFLYQLVHIIFYPIFKFVFDIFALLISTINELVGFVLSLMGLGLTVVTFISDFLGLFFVDAWTTIIMMQISIIVCLRVYYFLKDVSIFGNKV